MDQLNVYDKVRKARQIGRATTKDYVHRIFTDFLELHGDRCFSDDPAVVGGIANLSGMPVTVIGIEKGHEMSELVSRHFGCALPEGYRKALRLMKEAEKFHRPIICFVDTQGANCGKDAEERGEGAAIAYNLYEMSSIKTPIISIVIGEGGSGGALGLAVADEVWMLENAYYSVVSPEACASILFKDANRADEAAEHLKLTASDLYEYEIIERIFIETDDWSDSKQTNRLMIEMKKALTKKCKELLALSSEELLAARYEKYRKIGRCEQIISNYDPLKQSRISTNSTRKGRFFRHGR